MVVVGSRRETVKSRMLYKRRNGRTKASVLVAVAMK